MFNFAINNETIEVARPLPFLTVNPIYKGDRIMAGPRVANQRPNSNLVNRKRTYIEKGMRFGRLAIIEEVAPYRSPGGQTHRKVSAKCDCGNVTEAMLCQLTTGKTRSCGCLVKETMSKNMTKHGHSTHPIYRVWDAMKQRCYNPNDNSFVNYGGRGIGICEGWRNDFVLIGG